MPEQQYSTDRIKVSIWIDCWKVQYCSFSCPLKINCPPLFCSHDFAMRIWPIIWAKLLIVVCVCVLGGLTSGSLPVVGGHCTDSITNDVVLNVRTNLVLPIRAQARVPACT